MSSRNSRDTHGLRVGAVSAAVFMSNLDLLVVNVALPDIGRAFGGSGLNHLSWVLNAYAIVLAALLVVAGRMFDRHGHRTGFLLGLAVFTCGSAVCAAATSLGWLLFALSMVESDSWGWTSPGILASLSAVPAPLAMFLYRSARHRAPVVERPRQARGS